MLTAAKPIKQETRRIVYKISPWSDPSSNFNLEDGVSSVLSQLLPSCSSEKQFRALNLDITCPPSLPTVSSCHCLTKNQRGDLMSKTPGQIDYQVIK